MSNCIHLLVVLLVISLCPRIKFYKLQTGKKVPYLETTVFRQLSLQQVECMVTSGSKSDLYNWLLLWSLYISVLGLPLWLDYVTLQIVDWQLPGLYNSHKKTDSRPLRVTQTLLRITISSPAAVINVKVLNIPSYSTILIDRFTWVAK